MRHRILATGLVLAALAAGGSSRASIPPRTDVRCVVTEPSSRCGYFASGEGHYEAARVGAWVLRVWRDGALVWTTGAQSPASGWIPSRAGDRVEAAIVSSVDLCPPPQGVPPIRCHGAGAIVLSENIFR